MEKVQCMSLRSIYIHYNHEALGAAGPGGCLESAIRRVLNREQRTREPMTQRTCLLIVSSVGVKGGCLDGVVVICKS